MLRSDKEPSNEDLFTLLVPPGAKPGESLVIRCPPARLLSLSHALAPFRVHCPRTARAVVLTACAPCPAERACRAEVRAAIPGEAEQVRPRKRRPVGKAKRGGVVGGRGAVRWCDGGVSYVLCL